MKNSSGFSERLTHLHYCSYGNRKFINNLLQTDPYLSAVYSVRKAEVIQRCLSPNNEKIKSRMYKALENSSPRQLSEHLQSKNIQPITIYDRSYPDLLKQIPDPPPVLYASGLTGILDLPCRLSVVGTRDPSEAACNDIKQLLPDIIKVNTVIVSGLARGIDALSHRLACEREGYTIAVLGFGHDHLYPKQLQPLYQEMLSSQLVLSEYPPYMKAERWHFPERNRIISGLSMLTLIVEAKKKSGSLITADCALEQNRTVAALPGRIADTFAAGTNQLLSEGALPVFSSGDLLYELNRTQRL
ncbi:DNA processing protein [Salisediminibacterium halotolerans]|uniref:DNA processing protein n=1 Tax=Salisediminibacterium halotolerans TaxID=517425 RepID=A0A1H9Q2Z7_9BACI|nr:DNA processing protein [Salisediminibacterium haloalkalitolerans]